MDIPFVALPGELIMSSQSTSNTGSVGSLWRYAVKSMRGEELDEALVNEGGIFGDRAYAVIDPSNGRVASAKLPRKWSKLVDLSARLVEPRRSGDQVPPVRITWPDGASVTSNDEDAGALLSEHLGRAGRPNDITSGVRMRRASGSV